MITFIKRNIQVFFRDRSAVFFSLLAVLIIIGLYALFLGDVWLSDFSDAPGARQLMDTWLISGLLAVTSVTATLGAFGILVEDRADKIDKDFYAAPIRRSSITGGYLLSVFVIGVIMSIVALVLSEAYVVMNGGGLLGAAATVEVFGLIVLSSLANTAMMCFVVSFFTSRNAFATASTIVGTLVGFIAGIYLPIGSLPQGVQTAVKLFPVSHAAALFRQVVMEGPIGTTFAGAPADMVSQFKDSMGVTFRLGDFAVTPAVSIAFLCVAAVAFFGLSLLNMSRRRGF